MLDWWRRILAHRAGVCRRIHTLKGPVNMDYNKQWKIYRFLYIFHKLVLVWRKKKSKPVLKASPVFNSLNEDRKPNSESEKNSNHQDRHYHLKNRNECGEARTPFHHCFEAKQAIFLIKKKERERFFTKHINFFRYCLRGGITLLIQPITNIRPFLP